MRVLLSLHQGIIERSDDGSGALGEVFLRGRSEFGDVRGRFTTSLRLRELADLEEDVEAFELLPTGPAAIRCRWHVRFGGWSGLAG